MALTLAPRGLEIGVAENERALPWFGRWWNEDWEADCLRDLLDSLLRKLGLRFRVVLNCFWCTCFGLGSRIKLY